MNEKWKLLDTRSKESINGEFPGGPELSSSDSRARKGQSSSQFPRRVVAKNVLTIRHASKVMLKILHARLQHYVNQELPDV